MNIFKCAEKASLVVGIALSAYALAGCGGGGHHTTPTQPQIPSAPTGVAASATTSQVSLTWTAASGATSYNVYYQTATGVTPSSGTKLTSTNTSSYKHTGVTNGTTYYYVVTAVNSAGESAASIEVSAMPLAIPSGVTATPANGQVTLSWTAVSGASSYSLYYGTATGVTTATGTKVSGISSTSYTHSGLTNGTTYYYIVTAVNSSGESTASPQLSAKPVSPVVMPPAGLTAVPGDGQAVLSWTASSGATSYNLYYSLSPGVNPANAAKIGAVTGTTYGASGLTNGTLYYFAVTAANDSGESGVSNEVSVTPTNGPTVSLTPGTAASTTLQVNPSLSVNFAFDANAVGQPAIATITPIAQSGLPTPLARRAMFNYRLVPMVTADDTYITAFKLGMNPPSIVAFNVPVTLSGNVGDLIAENSTFNLAVLRGNLWVDVATLVVGKNGAFTENLLSVSLPGLLAPGTYLLYEPAKGSNTSVSNLGVVLLADDGAGMLDGSDGLQIVHIYDTNGNLLTTPVISFLDYPGASDLDGSALTPDGSQGVMVDGGQTVRFFSAVQTGVPLASTYSLDVSQWGADGDSIAILPNGDEAVVSLDTDVGLLIVSGILSGSPVVASTIPTVDYRDGLVISNDGRVLLARGYSGVTVYSVTPIAPQPGSIAGTVAHTYSQTADLPELGDQDNEDGRDGMAISPTDSSRAVVVSTNWAGSGTIQMVTGLPNNPVVGSAMTVPADAPVAVSITPDGKLAIVGTDLGLLLFSGVDTGNLVQVGTLYAPRYQDTAGNPMTLGYVSTLGITLDGKYVAVGDADNFNLLVIPFTSNGFAAPALVAPLGVGYNDQLLIH